jgi:hypothetical protein
MFQQSSQPPSELLGYETLGCLTSETACQKSKKEIRPAEGPAVGQDFLGCIQCSMEIDLIDLRGEGARSKTGLAGKSITRRKLDL